MPQVRKPAVAAAIEAAALRSFARNGFARTTVAGVASAAGTATANVYRYHRTKQDLFDAVVPSSLLIRHDILLDARIAALAAGSPNSPESQELLGFWLDHRYELVVLLDRVDGTSYADYPSRFVRRLVDHAVAVLDRPPTADHLVLLELVFDNTRRALASLLGGDTDRARTTVLIEGFWSYQEPGLAGLIRWPGAAQ
jgi:AcrR family transcriptional regulator